MPIYIFSMLLHQKVHTYVADYVSQLHSIFCIVTVENLLDFKIW